MTWQRQLSLMSRLQHCFTFVNVIFLKDYCCGVMIRGVIYFQAVVMDEADLMKKLVENFVKVCADDCLK